VCGFVPLMSHGKIHPLLFTVFLPVPVYCTVPVSAVPDHPYDQPEAAPYAKGNGGNAKRQE